MASLVIPSALYGTAHAFVFYPQIATPIAIGFAEGFIEGTTGETTKLPTSHPLAYVPSRLGFYLGKEFKERVCR